MNFVASKDSTKIVYERQGEELILVAETYIHSKNH